MTATKTRLPAFPSLTKVEMEDRKRSLLHDVDDLAPSRKRLKDERGDTMRMDDDKEKQVEEYQKDAILRQLKEYKRQKKDAEERLGELQKKSEFHDDHLRVVDAWFVQLLGEVRVLISELLPTPPPSAMSSTGEEMYTSALLFENSEMFSEHLQSRSSDIKGVISDLFGRLPPASPEVADLMKRLNGLLAKEKEHVVELRKAIDEKDSIMERYEQAMARYMTAERKLDRAKSSQVQKLERQAIMGGNGDNVSPTTSKAAGTPKREHADTNGELENGVASAEADAQRREALAVAAKQKAQLEEIEIENERLTNELSAARTKLASLSDDDYAETSLFKMMRSQYEDVVKRLNDLEYMNAQMRAESQKLQAERTSYRTQLDEESRNQTAEVETANARAEQDLARIRHTRDQLQSELAILKSGETNSAISIAHTKELVEAKDMRIAALESEVQRLQLQLGELDPAANSDIEGLDLDALRTRFRILENQHSLLSNELPSMEAAWKKTRELATRKIEEIAGMEEQVARASAEKSKADQKYFAAMKAKDMRHQELVMLRQQNERSTAIVTQLKDSEAKTREYCANYERQLAETKDALSKLESQQRTYDQKIKEAALSADALRKNVEELKALVGAKDKEVLGTAKARRQAEEDVEKYKSRLEDSKKQYDTLRKSRAAVNATDSDDWRRVAICPVCNANIRNTVIKLCGHVFCNACVSDLISNRSRKCPSCGKGFGSNDSMAIHLTG